MMKKEKNLRLTVTAILLLMIAAAGVGLYRSSTDGISEEKNEVAQEELAQQETLEESVTTPNAEVRMEEVEEESVEEIVEEPVEETVTEVVEEILPAIDFSDNSVMGWPVHGDVLIDYSMDGAVYFPTLEVYKYNPALVLGAEENQQVQAVANSKVISVTENEETGTTVTMDMGNGYQASYGQLKDVTVEPDQIIPVGTVIGTVAAPTKYYAKEGTNVYFAMTKDGEAIDPFMYMETEEE